MLKYFFAFIILIHGVIHFMGFAKAFSYGNIIQLTKFISKSNGVLWFSVAILFLIATVLFLLKKESWPYIAIIAVVISQILIITVWKDAKFGSIANVIILMVAIAAWSSQNFETHFRNDAKAHLLLPNNFQTDLLTEADIQSLPLPVSKIFAVLQCCKQAKSKKHENCF